MHRKLVSFPYCDTPVRPRFRRRISLEHGVLVPRSSTRGLEDGVSHAEPSALAEPARIRRGFLNHLRGRGALGIVNEGELPRPHEAPVPSGCVPSLFSTPIGPSPPPAYRTPLPQLLCCVLNLCAEMPRVTRRPKSPQVTVRPVTASPPTVPVHVSVRETSYTHDMRSPGTIPPSAEGWMAAPLERVCRLVALILRLAAVAATAPSVVATTPSRCWGTA